MKNQSFELKVPGTDFVIKSDTIYTVIPKPDPEAPDGFREHGTTKIIHPDIATVIGAPYSGDMGVWDTGFYMHSPCLNGMGDTEKDEFVRKINKIIVKPVEEIYGEGSLGHRKNDFYDSFVISLYNRVSFNTNDPLELLGLYFAVLSKQLCPKEYVGNPLFKYAAYQVVNRDKEITNKEQIEIDKAKAIGRMYNMLSSNKDKLKNILHYLRITTNAIEDEDTYFSIFKRWLEDKEDGFRNSKIFLDTLDKFSTEDGEEELFIYDKVNHLIEKGTIKQVKGELFLAGESLGNSSKHAAMKIVADAKLKIKVTEFLQGEDTD